MAVQTFGVQNTEADAHAQLDYYVKERNCNFIDTAEMYPVLQPCPPLPALYARLLSRTRLRTAIGLSNPPCESTTRTVE